MGDILRFPDKKIARGEDPAALRARLETLHEMLHTRRAQIALFCKDFQGLILAALDRGPDEGLLSLRKQVNAVATWARIANSSGYVASDITGAERAFTELLAHAQEVSDLFTAFVKSHGEALASRQSTVVHIGSEAHSATLARLLRTQADFGK